MRPAAKEQVQSLGGRFVELPIEAKDAQDARGYGTAQGEEFYRKQRELLGDAVAANDVVITAAVIPGKKSPVLVTKEMVARMAPGSVIVDLAAEQGGNCPLTKSGQVIEAYGVIIMGYANLPGRLAVDASSLYARNLFNFVSLLVDKKTGNAQINWDDEIIKGANLTRGGAITHPALKAA